MTENFTHAIARSPCPAMVDGLTGAGLGRPDHAAALQQHAAYVRALQDCGVAVALLPPLPDFPDSCFVEDVALCTSRGAVVTRPGAESRRGETAGIEPALAAVWPELHRIEAPGTVEAGDIMRAGDRFFIGLTGRTNAAGAAQMATILERLGYRATTVAVDGALHLKTCVNYLEGGVLLAWPGIADHDAFRDYRTVTVDEDEAYAANSLWVNGRVIVPAGFPRTRAAIERAGYPTIEVDVSEFRKLDGGLSCLSLRFAAPGG